MNATFSPSSQRPPSSTRLGTLVAALGVAASLFSNGVAAASPAAPAPEFWMPNGNDSLLLNTETVTALVGVGGLKVGGVSSQAADSSARVSPAACVDVYGPAEATAYPDATSVTAVSMDDAKDDAVGHLIEQSILGFADSSTARARFDEVSVTWARCAGQALVVKSRTGKPKNWTVGLPAPATDDASRVVTNIGSGGVCERALTMRDAIVVDVRACTMGDVGGADGQASVIAAAVRDNIAHRDG